MLSTVNMLRIGFIVYFAILAMLSLYFIKQAVTGISLCLFCVFVIYVLVFYKE